MSEERFLQVKQGVLDHMQTMFEEMEEEAAMSHQEKYAILEDAFESAVDEDELRVAFEQWYQEHADDLQLEYSMEDLWDQATSSLDE